MFAVRNQWDELSTAATEGFDDLLGWVQTLPFPIDEQQVEDARNSIVDFLTSAEFGQTALSGVSRATEFVAGLLLMLVVLFFFLKDGDRIWAFFMRPFRGERLERGRRVGVTSVKVLGGYVRGTAIVALVDAVAIGIGLVVLQVPLALPLSVIVFLTAFIPLVGATVAGILAALVALVANGPVVALIVIAIVIVVNQLEGDLLQPVVMAQSLKLHPLVILIALTAGTIVAGIIGAVLAVPLTAVGWAIIKVWDGPDPTIDERKSLRRRRRRAEHPAGRLRRAADRPSGADSPVASHREDELRVRGAAVEARVRGGGVREREHLDHGRPELAAGDPIELGGEHRTGMPGPRRREERHRDEALARPAEGARERRHRARRGVASLAPWASDERESHDGAVGCHDAAHLARARVVDGRGHAARRRLEDAGRRLRVAIVDPRRAEGLDRPRGSAATTCRSPGARPLVRAARGASRPAPRRPARAACPRVEGRRATWRGRP